MNATLGWGLALLALAAGYASYGWPGLLLAVTVVVFWLLLQFNRTVRVLRSAAGRPVGHVQSAVMLHSQLHAGMRLPEILKLTRSLGQTPPGAPAGDDAHEESFQWTDAGGDRVEVQLRAGVLSEWHLHRTEGAAT